MRSRIAVVFYVFAVLLACGPGIFAADAPPLRVAIAGLVHGHASGFFSHALERKDVAAAHAV